MAVPAHEGFKFKKPQAVVQVRGDNQAIMITDIKVLNAVAARASEVAFRQ